MLLEVLEILGRASLPSKKPAVGCRCNNSPRAKSCGVGPIRRNSGHLAACTRRVGGFIFYPCEISLCFHPRNHPGAILAVFGQARPGGRTGSAGLRELPACQYSVGSSRLPRCGLQKKINKKNKNPTKQARFLLFYVSRGNGAARTAQKD